MISIALTGGIASGKSVTSSMFAFHGAKIFNADEVIHNIMDSDDTVINTVHKIWGDEVIHRDRNKINRKALGDIVFFDDDSLNLLEEILYPILYERRKKFITEMRRKGTRIIVHDIPLLFEKNIHLKEKFDSIVVTSCPSRLQKIRALKRFGMNEEKFAAIIEKQMKYGEREKLADYVVHTGIGKAFAMRMVKHIIRECR